MVCTMSDAPSRLSISVAGDRITVSGEIDAFTAPSLVEALTPFPAEGDVRLDLSGVEFMDSSGLRLMIDTHQRANAESRSLIISNPSKVVHRLMEMSGVIGHLHVELAG
jgi:anti-sigma B factor antagonist